MIFAESVGHLDDCIESHLGIVRTVLDKPNKCFRLRFGFLWRQFTLRQRRDDPKRLLRLFVLLVEPSLDAAAEGDVVARQKTVVNDLVLERQQYGLNQSRQIRTNQFFKRVGESQDAVGFFRRVGAQEDGVLRQIAKNEELPDDGVLPTGDDGQLIGGKLGWVLLHKLVEQFSMRKKGVPNGDPGSGFNAVYARESENCSGMTFNLPFTKDSRAAWSL